MAVHRYTEEMLMQALITFGAMYLALDDQALIDAAERALDMLLAAAHEKELGDVS